MRFDLELVLEGVRGTRFAGLVRHLEVTGSTSTLAMEAAISGEAEGVWVADEQTAGRGRGGHGWHSVAGDGLYVSVLVRPQLRMIEATVLPLAVGLAAKEAVRQVAGKDADLRWPNDLMLGGRMVEGRPAGAKKFGGILVESAAGGHGADAEMRFAVIGVGINANHQRFPEELREMATSLRVEGGAEVSREELLVALLRGLDGELSGLADAGGVERVVERFGRASSWVRGKRVRVGEGEDSYTAETLGLTERGFLRVARPDGEERLVLSGGVRELT